MGAVDRGIREKKWHAAHRSRFSIEHLGIGVEENGP
jgi:hypothetical protein